MRTPKLGCLAALGIAVALVGITATLGSCAGLAYVEAIERKQMERTRASALETWPASVEKPDEAEWAAHAEAGSWQR